MSHTRERSTRHTRAPHAGLPHVQRGLFDACGCARRGPVAGYRAGAGPLAQGLGNRIQKRVRRSGRRQLQDPSPHEGLPPGRHDHLDPACLCDCRSEGLQITAIRNSPDLGKRRMDHRWGTGSAPCFPRRLKPCRSGRRECIRCKGPFSGIGHQTGVGQRFGPAVSDARQGADVESLRLVESTEA